MQGNVKILRGLQKYLEGFLNKLIWLIIARFRSKKTNLDFVFSLPHNTAASFKKGYMIP